MIGFVRKWLRPVFDVNKSINTFCTNSTLEIKNKLFFLLGVTLEWGVSIA